MARSSPTSEHSSCSISSASASGWLSPCSTSSQAADAAGELDGRVLEAAAGAEERDPPLAGHADRGQHAVGAAVRAARDGPDAVEARPPPRRRRRSRSGARRPRPPGRPGGRSCRAPAGCGRGRGRPPSGRHERDAGRASGGHGPMMARRASSRPMNLADVQISDPYLGWTCASSARSPSSPGPGRSRRRPTPPGYTQSAISQHVAALEASLGRRLLERRPVRLTPGGRAAAAPRRRDPAAARRSRDRAAAAAGPRGRAGRR